MTEVTSMKRICRQRSVPGSICSQRILKSIITVDFYLSQVKDMRMIIMSSTFFLEGNVNMVIGGKDHAMRPGDIVLIPPKERHHAVIRTSGFPTGVFVFWITEEYCNSLMETSSDYAYLMQHVKVTKNYIFHTDVVTFNTIRSKVFGLIDEMRSKRFGREAKISLCVSDLILHLNRVVHEQNYPKSEREEMNLYQGWLII